MFAALPALAQEKKPNIVFFLVDNVGWGNFQVYGGTVPTPRIDKLASEGIRFNNYKVEVQCTPTRSAIQTGRHPVRSGTYTVPFPGQGKAGMAPWEYTIAKLLSDAGYAGPHTLAHNPDNSRQSVNEALNKYEKTSPPYWIGARS